MKSSPEIVKFIVPGSGILALGWIQYGEILKMYWFNHIFFCTATVVGDKVMNCYYFHIVLKFDCEIYYPGYVAEIGAFRLGGGERGDKYSHKLNVCFT